MEEDEQKKLDKSDIVKLVAIVVFFIAIFVYSVVTDGNFNNFSKKKNITSTDISEMLEPIKDNYTLKIKKEINGKEETIEYITDGTLKLYDVVGDKKGYIVYKNKVYKAEEGSYKLKEVKNKPSYINDHFVDINFIKKIVHLCDIKDVGQNRLNCYINVSDYLDEYNIYFNTRYTYDGTEQLLFNFDYKVIVKNINVDYSLINNIMGKDDKIIYSINIGNVDGNDYSNLFEVFKDSLKK